MAVYSWQCMAVYSVWQCIVGSVWSGLTYGRAVGAVYNSRGTYISHFMPLKKCLTLLFEKNFLTQLLRVFKYHVAVNLIRGP